MAENMNQLDLTAQLEELRQLREKDLLSESAYQAAVAGIMASQKVEVNNGAAAIGTDATAVGHQGVNAGDVDGDIITGKKFVVYAEKGAKVVIGDEATVPMTAVDRATGLGRYLEYLIAHNRYLQLQGIRSGGRLVHIELENLYVTLRATQQREVTAEEHWLRQEMALAPGERQRFAHRETITETVTVSVNEALAAHRRLVVLGDPGSGKTTLLRYLALLYARDLAQATTLVHTKLGLAESGHLPILIPLRRIGAFLQKHSDESIEGHGLLLDFLHEYLQQERLTLLPDFFDPYLKQGRAVILLDGLDEVAGNDLRRRVARLVEAFTQAYPTCRYVVTSRIVGYTGPARLGEAYATTTVRDFTLEDVAQFLTDWHRLIAIGQMGPGEPAENMAARQTGQLLDAIRTNERILELAINPLMLTVLALVHRDRVKLPDRRAELYQEAVDVLLGKWDEARGIVETPILENQPFDAVDKRLLLQHIALTLHEQQQKEIESEPLHRLLSAYFAGRGQEQRLADRAADRFLQVVMERSGLLTARGDGVYAFSHLTFQEYLAALEIAGRADCIPYTLPHTGSSWWREVILLVAGSLSLRSSELTSRFIQAIADHKPEPVPYHNLVLASACLRDVGQGRVLAGLLADIQRRLRQGVETPIPRLVRWSRGIVGAKEWLDQRSAAVTALVQSGGGFWTEPYGEPEWVEIPAGEFIMGSNDGEERERPQHRLFLPTYWIARVPITNAQYYLFTQATGHSAPVGWENERPRKELESHPVVRVFWDDAQAYCRWLSEMTGKTIRLPSEAEWEKAARGPKDARVYPWGDTFDRLRCNTKELGLGTTTPVGIFPDGASPYGVLDMSGNVFEWTQSRYRPYPYRADDGRELVDNSGEIHIWRGGSYLVDKDWGRCACRDWDHPDDWFRDGGFRAVVSPSTSGL